MAKFFSMADNTGIATAEDQASTLQWHFHNMERWYGSTAGVAPAVLDALVPYRVTTSATANTFGTAVLIMNGTETGQVFQNLFDFRRIQIENVQSTDTYILRFAFNLNNEVNAAAAVANGHYTEMLWKVDATNNDATPLDMWCGQIPLGKIIWVQAAKKTSGAAYVDFYAGLHWYPARPDA
jgi:hypothetical protein